MVPLGSVARFEAAHHAIKQAVHLVPTTVCVEFLSEKCRGSTSDPMDAFFSIAILTGLRLARRVGRRGGGAGAFHRVCVLQNYWCHVCVKLLVYHYTSSMLAARG